MRATQTATKSQRLSRARRALAGKPPTRAARPSQPGLSDPDIWGFVTAALAYRKCARHYDAATSAWRRFTVANPFDDPAHADHQQRVTSARNALNMAEVDLQRAAAAVGVTL